MKTTCEFKDVEKIESFCKKGSETVFNPRNHTHFIAVEGYLGADPLDPTKYFLVGFPGNIYEGMGMQKENTGLLLRNLARIFPQMRCVCAHLKEEGRQISSERHTYYAWEMSCPHFGIRAATHEKLNTQ